MENQFSIYTLIKQSLDMNLPTPQFSEKHITKDDAAKTLHNHIIQLFISHIIQ